MHTTCEQECHERFIQGDSQEQHTLRSEWPGDYVGRANPVRVVDAFVELYMAGLGFGDIAPAITRQPRHLFRQICSTRRSNSPAEKNAFRIALLPAFLPLRPAENQ